MNNEHLKGSEKWEHSAHVKQWRVPQIQALLITALHMGEGWVVMNYLDFLDLVAHSE